MFISTTLRDVRLAYVPPRSVGEFGGEDDNWVWPRHTGDFSFVRAYAGPDGKPADYAPGNVPYHPKRFLKVNPKGVEEDDFVFILGYPGRTYRHQTSYYMAYEENLRMPFVADLNDWQIRTMEELGRGDRATALKFDARIKGLANTMKNYRGKLVGMKRLGLVATKRDEEAALQKYIDADPQRKATYGTVLEQTGKVYAEMTEPRAVRAGARHLHRSVTDVAARPDRRTRCSRRAARWRSRAPSAPRLPRRRAGGDEEGVGGQLRELPRAGREAVPREGCSRWPPSCRRTSGSRRSTNA